MKPLGFCKSEDHSRFILVRLVLKIYRNWRRKVIGKAINWIYQDLTSMNRRKISDLKWWATASLWRTTVSNIWWLTTCCLLPSTITYLGTIVSLYFWLTNLQPSSLPDLPLLFINFTKLRWILYSNPCWRHLVVAICVTLQSSY